MSRATNNIGKRIYYNENRVIVKDSKGTVLGSFFLKSANLIEIFKQRMKIAALNNCTTTHSNKINTTGLCIIRYNGKYHVTYIPSDFSFTGISCHHLCSDCAHCYASSTEGKGCPKIQDRHFESVPQNYSLKNALISSSRIEKYSFILNGVETFGCGASEVFLVLECENFCSDSRTPKKVSADVHNNLLATYQQLQKESNETELYIKRRKKIRFPYNTHPYQ